MGGAGGAFFLCKKRESYVLYTEELCDFGNVKW